MNILGVVLALTAACFVGLVAYELLPQAAAPADQAIAPSQAATVATPAPPATLDPASASLADTLLARPLFSQTRRPPNVASPVIGPASAGTPLPRMTGILIDGPRRSAIFAAPGGKPTIVAEGGRIGSFTVQAIEPQQVIVIGPEGKRTVRTSFDPSLAPPAPQSFGLAIPQFPGIVVPGGPPPSAPSPGYGLPQSAGAAR